MKKSPIQVAVTGGAGSIAYQLLFRIAAGEMFGQDQPLVLKIVELPEALFLLEAVKMELQDGAFPLLYGVEITSDPFLAFQDIDYAILIGAKPRSQGMERKDLLKQNGHIFVTQGQALNAVAKKQAKVLVVGNPCNTNCLIALHQAPRLSEKNFFAMTRLDQNRATHFLAEKAAVLVEEVSHVAIWGNHSATQVVDFIHAKIRGEPLSHFISDRKWLEETFLAKVQQRGAEVIKMRGKSSAGSAAQAIIDAMSDILLPTEEGQWFSSAIYASHNPYGIAGDLVFSFPSYVDQEGVVAPVPGLYFDEFLAKKLQITEIELQEERECIKHLMGV